MRAGCHQAKSSASNEVLLHSITQKGASSRKYSSLSGGVVYSSSAPECLTRSLGALLDYRPQASAAQALGPVLLASNRYPYGIGVMLTGGFVDLLSLGMQLQAANH
jgi:hypothetical protein